MTHNFCEGCNRVRLTCTGTLCMCLGQSDATIIEAITRKPKGHDFVIDREHRAPAVGCHMSVTGG